MLDKVISVFPTVKATDKPHDRLIKLVLNRIKEGSPTTIDKIENIRSITNKGGDTRAKKILLPNFCFSGTFVKRKYEDGNEHNLTSYTGIVLIDMDKVENIARVKEQVCADPFTAVCFVSVSGQGLKILVQTDNTDHRQHRLYTQELVKYYSRFGNVDEDGSRIAQGTYDTYDPELYLNPTSQIWTEKAEYIETHYTGKKEDYTPCPFTLSITDEYTLYQRAVEFRNKYDSFTEGRRNHYVYSLAVQCNKLGISESYATGCILQDFVEKGFGREEAMNAVKSGYGRRELFGTVKLRDRDKYQMIRSMKETDTPKGVIVEKIQQQAKERNERLNPDDIEQAILEVENEVQGVYQTFWDTFQKDPDRPESPWLVKFNYQKWFKWNKLNGVFLYYPAGDRSGDYMFIRVRNNIVTYLEKSYFPRVIKDYLETLPPVVDNVTRDTLVNTFAASIDKITSARKLEMFAESPINFIQDTKDNIHFYFRNTVVKVTENDVNMIGYEQIDNCVWDNKIIKQQIIDLRDEKRSLEDFLRMGKGKFDFGDWILKTCDNDIEAAKNLCAVLGYLMHGYKDPSNPRAVVFLETPLAGNPEGGTGKGILIQALQQMRSVIRENGKIANPKDKFWAQSIKLDTDIFCIEDVQKNFEFEDIFSVITDGLTVEGKYRSKFYIPYEKSPKIAITTNYPFRGGGSSHERRKYELELSHSFKQQHKDPISYYGRRFFSADWNDADWQLFYYFMFECSRHYLSLRGELNISHSDALSIRKFIRNTSHDWAAFAAAYLEPGRFYAKAEVHKKYLETTNSKSGISVQRVTDYVKEFAKYAGCEVVDKKKENHRGFVLEPVRGAVGDVHLKLISLKNDSGIDTPDDPDGDFSDEPAEGYFETEARTELPF